jgi:hypothetical protein
MNNMQITLDGMQGTIQSDGQVRFGNDTQTNVIFYKKSVLDPIKSREQGRPFYISKDYVRIQQPGEHLNIVDRPVDDDRSVIRRWPQHYQKFLDNQEPVPEGTPTELLFPNSPEISANLHTQAVHTVEQLSNLTAHALQSIGMGAVEWQNMARKFLDSAAGGKEHHRLVSQISELQNKNEVLNNQIAIMQAQLNRLAAAQQGVPPAMINQRTTVAQQYQETLPEQQSFGSGQYKGPFPDATQTEMFKETETIVPPRNKRK